MKPVVAAFDFDGTLSDGVSGMRFFHQLLGTRSYAWFWIRRFPELLCYSRRFRHEGSLARINRHVFTGRHVAAVEAEAQSYWRTTLPRYLVPEAMAQLHAHLARGERCVIVSRGYEMYLQPWAESIGVRDVIATKLSADSRGILTGEMPDPSCDGLAKRSRLEQRIGPLEQYELHAYGDGPGDFALLAAADLAFIRAGRGFQRWTATS